MGTIISTAPTGHTYATGPHGGTLFPALAHSTGELGDITVPDQSPHRGLMMPTRRQTREQDRRDRITKECQHRKELNNQQRQRGATLATNENPHPSKPASGGRLYLP